MRGSRSARRSARSEEGARSVPRERSVLRRAPKEPSVILPIHAEGSLTEEQGEAIFEAVDETLGAEGADVIGALELIDARTDGQIPCADPTCLGAILAHYRAEVALEIIVRFTPEGGPRQIVVTLLDGDNPVGNESQMVDERPLGEVVRACLLAARAQQHAGAVSPVIVRVVGEPAGAAVVIDGQPAGTIPYRGELTPGPHRLTVSRPGYVTQRRELTVSEGMGQVQVSLDPAGGGGIAGWAMPVGIIAMVVGVGIAVLVPAVGAATAGCADELGGTCVASNRLSVESAIAWGIVGGVLAIGGLVLVIVAASEGSAGPSVRARVVPTGVSLEGRF